MDQRSYTGLTIEYGCLLPNYLSVYSMSFVTPCWNYCNLVFISAHTHTHKHTRTHTHTNRRYVSLKTTETAPSLCALMSTMQYLTSQLLTTAFNIKFQWNVECSIVLPIGAFADVRKLGTSEKQSEKPDEAGLFFRTSRMLWTWSCITVRFFEFPWSVNTKITLSWDVMSCSFKGINISEELETCSGLHSMTSNNTLTLFHCRVHRKGHWSLSSVWIILSTLSHPIDLRFILILSPSLLFSLELSRNFRFFQLNFYIHVSNLP
jgi:hypothetical protein